MDTTARWLSMLGIGTLCCGISLFGNNSDTNYYCLVIIGIPLVAPWLYVDANSKHQKKINTDTSITTQVCMFNM